MLTSKVSVTLRLKKGGGVRREQKAGRSHNRLFTWESVVNWTFLSVSGYIRRQSGTYIWAEEQGDATYWLAGRLLRRGTGQGTESVKPPKWTPDDGRPKHSHSCAYIVGLFIRLSAERLLTDHGRTATTPCGLLNTTSTSSGLRIFFFSLQDPPHDGWQVSPTTRYVRYWSIGSDIPQNWHHIPRYSFSLERLEGQIYLLIVGSPPGYMSRIYRSDLRPAVLFG